MLLPASVLGATCTINDLTPVTDALTKCYSSASSTTFNPLTATTDSFSTLCKVADCKTAFQKYSLSLSCSLGDDSVKKTYNCGTSGSNVALVSGAALALASIVAMLF
ncbi:hypothetical protein AeMF1_019922 [Aphanomyces euteiches]|nr:hypothetical protein AeMF1_019922 [Aphanomyces euteiches]KAH9183311.1 hypothetical protein AeNC1_014717 [Aphanomyces euteiches]